MGIEKIAGYFLKMIKIKSFKKISNSKNQLTLMSVYVSFDPLFLEFCPDYVTSDTTNDHAQSVLII